MTRVLVEIMGISHFGIGRGGSISTPDVLPSALLGGNNEMRHNFGDFEAIVTSQLERALGTLEVGLWSPGLPSPVLVIHDDQLRERCLDLLNAPGSYDRVIREATTVLEDRIRNRPPSEVLARLIPNSADQSGENLINRLFSPDNPVLEFSSDRNKQIAFHKILLGVFSYFRNQYHHRLDADTEWSWAWSTVGLIDGLLDAVGSCSLIAR